MKIRTGSILFVLVLLLSIFSCEKNETFPVSTFNQLQVDGAILPVYMQGNKSSKVAIVVLHGGPGESAILKRDAIGFNLLESEHLMVYYDQRASGITSGNVAAESITIEQMSEDLNAVVQLVDDITATESVFIVSLDWGSAIAAEYLTSSLIHPKVKGYIASSPVFNASRNLTAMRDSLQGLADFIGSQDETADDNLQQFLAQNATITNLNYREYYRVLESLNGVVFNTEFETADVELPSFVKRSVENNEQYVLENLTYQGNPFIPNMNLENKLVDIPVPTKLIWGSRDLLFPPSLAFEYAELLGVPSDAEQISFLNFSANRPYYEEGSRFYAIVSTWLTFFD